MRGKNKLPTMTKEEKRIRHKLSMRKWYKKNKVKCLMFCKKWREKNYKEVRKRERSREYKHSFNITLENYDEMLEQQKGVCAICGGKNIEGRRLCVDHDHITGTIRGLLCGFCNNRIGWYERLQEQIHKHLKKSFL